MAFTDATRSLNIATSLGKDAIQLVQLRGEEELSRLFHFELGLISSNATIAAEDIIGTNLTFSIDYDDGKQRYFNGIVERFAAGDEDVKGVRSYRAIVVPWLWFLTQTTDCRIFQEMTVVEIIEKIFKDLGFTDFETSHIAGTHPKREYCVQYRESDFEFVSRLMEEEGIFYYFKHENAKHTLVMADQSSAYVPCKEAEIDFPRDENESRHKKAHIQSWEHLYQFRTGAWAHTDYNFKQPKTRLMTTEKTIMKFRNAKSFERYDYPGEYADKGIGAPLARIRMEESELEHNLVVGSSGCKSLSPGHKFTVGRHRAKTEEGKSYVVRKIMHEAREISYETGNASGVDYVNQFECFPSSATFRPARVTPKPVMRGCQTAVVTGPPGEEIYPDEFGRVKVQFHWDREGKYNDKSSCWIRVSQMHAGKGWGYMDLPRIDEEVIVDFLEGDPDQPIIIGRVYNGMNKPPFDLPAQKTRRGNSTKTYKGGGFNEMSMDDTPGKEQIRIHGQYNMDTAVGNNQTLKVGLDRQILVGNDETYSVINNQSIKIGVDQVLDVGSNRSTTVHANHTENVTAAQTVSVGADQTTKVGASQNNNVGANQTNSIGSVQSTTVGLAENVMVGGFSNEMVGFIKNVNVGVALSTLVGAYNYERTAGEKYMIAGSSIEIKCGASLITMDAAGKIIIKGTNILIDSSGPTKINGGPIDLN